MILRIGIALALSVAVAAAYGCVVPNAVPANNSRTTAGATNASNGNDSNANAGSVASANAPESVPVANANAGVEVAPVAPSTTASVLGPGLHALTFVRPGLAQPVNYLLFLPEHYGEGKRFPLIFYLHGKSLSGDEPQVLTKYGVPKVASRDLTFPFIVVAPQCRAGERWTDVDTLDALLADALATYPVDPDRVYLTGFSMGAGGAWRFGGARPERFAAVVAVAGVAELGAVKGLSRVPVWAFHGTDDQEVPATASQAMVDAIRLAGGDARLELLPGRGHDIVDVYDRKDLYSWFLEHRRRP